MYQFKKLVIGGTFDHLHKGHEAFLAKAFSLGQKVIIGLTSDSYIFNKQIAREILPYQLRRKELMIYLQKNNWLSRVTIVSIIDPYGPAVLDPSIEAILVTSETFPNAAKINSLRQNRKMGSLRILITNYILGTDLKRITSTRIRMGEEDRLGNVFFSKTFSLGGRNMPDTLRTTLHQPFGKVFSGVNAFNEIAKLCLGEKHILITVGDVVTKDAIVHAIIPDLAIIDLRVGRKKVHPSTSFFSFPKTISKIRIINKPGTLSQSLFNGVAGIFKKIIMQKRKYVIEILGQEDLATLPSILLSPLGSIVLYGQPDKGIVVVLVTEEIKEKVFTILSHFVKQSFLKKT